jgi:hypothetical protein
MFNYPAGYVAPKYTNIKRPFSGKANKFIVENRSDIPNKPLLSYQDNKIDRNSIRIPEQNINLVEAPFGRDKLVNFTTMYAPRPIPIGFKSDELAPSERLSTEKKYLEMVREEEKKIRSNLKDKISIGAAKVFGLLPKKDYEKLPEKIKGQIKELENDYPILSKGTITDQMKHVILESLDKSTLGQMSNALFGEVPLKQKKMIKLLTEITDKMIKDVSLPPSEYAKVLDEFKKGVKPLQISSENISYLDKKFAPEENKEAMQTIQSSIKKGIITEDNFSEVVAEGEASIGKKMFNFDPEDVKDKAILSILRDIERKLKQGATFKSLGLIEPDYSERDEEKYDDEDDYEQNILDLKRMEQKIKEIPEKIFNEAKDIVLENIQNSTIIEDEDVMNSVISELKSTPDKNGLGLNNAMIDYINYYRYLIRVTGKDFVDLGVRGVDLGVRDVEVLKDKDVEVQDKDVEVLKDKDAEYVEDKVEKIINHSTDVSQLEGIKKKMILTIPKDKEEEGQKKKYMELVDERLVYLYNTPFKEKKESGNLLKGEVVENIIPGEVKKEDKDVEQKEDVEQEEDPIKENQLFKEYIEPSTYVSKKNNNNKNYFNPAYIFFQAEVKKYNQTFNKNKSDSPSVFFEILSGYSAGKDTKDPKYTVNNMVRDKLSLRDIITNTTIYKGFDPNSISAGIKEYVEGERGERKGRKKKIY